MKNMLTITRKGQTTLPAAIRRQLGVGADGGILQFRFDAESGQLVITKPMSVDELSRQVGRHVKSKVKPVLNVDDYYQTNRKVA